MSDGDNQVAFEFKDKGLGALLTALKTDPKAKVGILAGHTMRTVAEQKEAGVTAPAQNNAEIGAHHEFGTEKMAMRSFLRIPLTDQMQNYLDRAGAFSKTVIQEIIDMKSLVGFVRKMGVVAERLVVDGFDSGGFGKWAPLKAATIARKKNNQILVETQQLRNSITSDVVE